jgi:hypothetical protein
MAKKVRQKPEATEESRFEFPVFDERAFVHHELELTTGTILALLWAVIAGVLSGVLSLLAGGAGNDLFLALALVVGIAVVASSAVIFPRLHDSVDSYTRGDWAGLFMLEIFGWVGLWFLIAGVFAGR